MSKCNICEESKSLDKEGNCFICWLLSIYNENKDFVDYLLK